MKTILYVPGEHHYIMLAPYIYPEAIRQISTSLLKDSEEVDDRLPPSTIYWYIQYPDDHQIEFSTLTTCLNTSMLSIDRLPTLPLGAVSANCYCGKTRIHSLISGFSN